MTLKAGAALPFGVATTGGGVTGVWSGSVLGLGAGDIGVLPLWNCIELFLITSVLSCMHVTL